jgi:hypothetical protein
MVRPDAHAAPAARTFLLACMVAGPYALRRPTQRNPASATYQALRVLAADVRDLALDLQAGTYTRTTVAMLQRDLRRAVPSALGASISFDLDVPSGVPKTINLVERILDPDEIAAGLRLPLMLPQQSLRGSLLLYASKPGAFDDVVDDLSNMLNTPLDEADREPPLPRQPVSPSVVHVEDFSLVNDALGVLINRGHSLTGARNQLQDEASRTGTGLPRAARKLLDELPIRYKPGAAQLIKSVLPLVGNRRRPPASS